MLDINKKTILAVAALTQMAMSPLASAQNMQTVQLTAAEARAQATVDQMTADEKVVLTLGLFALPLGADASSLPAGAIPGAGYIEGIERLGVPALKETDASLGVTYVGGMRKDGATALPSSLAQAASWNPDLVYRGSAMIGSEARAKGFNVLLAGGANLMRDPRNGRTFEYFSEDPLLTGVLVGAAIRGVQSNSIMSTIKHLAFNGQETARKIVDAKIGEPAARESDLLAFQIGIEQGQPGSVMCAYNRVNGSKACDSDWLLNKVLKQSWGYKGFVMSDWGAVPGVGAALNGLDQQSGSQLDKAVFFSDVLKQRAASDPAYAARLDDMNKRILTAIYAAGLDKHPTVSGGAIDFDRNAAVAEKAARQGIVLLRNERAMLPLARSAKRIVVIGGHADAGVLSGFGSSQVHGEGGPALVVPVAIGGGGIAYSQQYHRSIPLEAIKAMAPDATVIFRDGRYIAEAVEKAKQAEIVIVFANEWRTEGGDVPDLSLPSGQDQLIAAVAEANPNTIVVLQTGGPVKMPWLEKTAAVIEAWYPGARGGQAIASVLFGETNPGGRLPITFPADESQLPRPRMDGIELVTSAYSDDVPPGSENLRVNYDIEGSDVGYRWFARKGIKPLFPFGFGLSYTSFSTSGLSVKGTTATFTIANTGKRAGDDVAQLYLVNRAGEKKRRLVAFQRVSLKPGARQKVILTIDPRMLADWQEGGWSMPAGDYGFALGRNAEDIGPIANVRMDARSWTD